MEQSFDAIIAATVRQAKAGRHLLWADQIAERIANATPLPIDRKTLVNRLAAAAVHEGVPVGFGPGEDVRRSLLTSSSLLQRINQAG